MGPLVCAQQSSVETPSLNRNRTPLFFKSQTNSNFPANKMEYFRFVPPTLLGISTVVVAMPNPQVAFTGGVGGSAPAPAAAPTRAAPAPPAPAAPSGAPPAPNTRFLGFNSAPTQRPQQQQVFGGFGPFIPAVNANSNQGLANTGAGLGLGAVGAIAAGNCLFGQNCDLSFRPSLGAAVDANGQIVPQLGVTTQVGVGGFVAGGINDGNADGIGLGAQTGFGFSQTSQGGLDATAQLGGNVQAPQLAGVQFNRPNTALGVQPTLLGQGRPDLNLFNLFGR